MSKLPQFALEQLLLSSGLISQSQTQRNFEQQFIPEEEKTQLGRQSDFQAFSEGGLMQVFQNRQSQQEIFQGGEQEEQEEEKQSDFNVEVIASQLLDQRDDRRVQQFVQNIMQIPRPEQAFLITEQQLKNNLIQQDQIEQAQQLLSDIQEPEVEEQLQQDIQRQRQIQEQVEEEIKEEEQEEQEFLLLSQDQIAEQLFQRRDQEQIRNFISSIKPQNMPFKNVSLSTIKKIITQNKRLSDISEKILQQDQSRLSDFSRQFIDNRFQSTATGKALRQNLTKMLQEQFDIKTGSNKAPQNLEQILSTMNENEQQNFLTKLVARTQQNSNKKIQKQLSTIQQEIFTQELQEREQTPAQKAAEEQKRKELEEQKQQLEQQQQEELQQRIQQAREEEQQNVLQLAQQQLDRLREARQINFDFIQQNRNIDIDPENFGRQAGQRFGQGVISGIRSIFRPQRSNRNIANLRVNNQRIQQQEEQIQSFLNRFENNEDLTSEDRQQLLQALEEANNLDVRAQNLQSNTNINLRLGIGVASLAGVDGFFNWLFSRDDDFIRQQIQQVNERLQEIQRQQQNPQNNNSQNQQLQNQQQQIQDQLQDLKDQLQQIQQNKGHIADNIKDKIQQIGFDNFQDNIDQISQSIADRLNSLKQNQKIDRHDILTRTLKFKGEQETIKRNLKDLVQNIKKQKNNNQTQPPPQRVKQSRVFKQQLN